MSPAVQLVALTAVLVLALVAAATSLIKIVRASRPR